MSVEEGFKQQVGIHPKDPITGQQEQRNKPEDLKPTPKV
jgi:hypothetical protein